jgi:hypothetical protein
MILDEVSKNKKAPASERGSYGATI